MKCRPLRFCNPANTPESADRLVINKDEAGKKEEEGVTKVGRKGVGADDPPLFIRLIRPVRTM